MTGTDAPSDPDTGPGTGPGSDGGTGPGRRRPRWRWTRGRVALLGVCLASLVGMVAVGVEMASRLDAYNRTEGRRLFVFQPITDRAFTWAGIPVRFEDQTDPDGADVVVMTFGERTRRLRSGLRSLPPEVPGLKRHESWLGVLRFAERRGMSIEELHRAVASGEADERLAVVVRKQRPGVDQDSFGRIMRADWRFQILELKPDGTIEESLWRYPESERSFQRRVDRARRAGEPIPERREDELAFGSWQFEAALNVIPKGGAPAPQFGRGAMDALGWTLPTATALSFTALLSLAFAIAPDRVRRREDRAGLA